MPNQIDEQMKQEKHVVSKLIVISQGNKTCKVHGDEVQYYSSNKENLPVVASTKFKRYHRYAAHKCDCIIELNGTSYEGHFVKGGSKRTKGFKTSDHQFVAYSATNWLFWIFLVIAFCIAALLLGQLNGCFTKPANTYVPPKFDLTYDDEAEDGEKEKKPQEEIEEEIAAAIEAGMITISMSLSPTISDGTMLLDIYNDKTNRYPQVIELYLYEGEEVASAPFYTTGLIGVDQRLETVKFDTDLPAGEYKAVAYFTAVDDTTGNGMGTAGANVTLIVK